MWVVGREEMPFRPEPRTFMFTYFPEREKKFLPPDIVLRVEADKDCRGGKFEQAVLITPTGVFTHTGSAKFYTARLKKQMRAGSRDLHTGTKVVRIACSSSCEHSPESPDEP
jgi:hypothetical protein